MGEINANHAVRRNPITPFPFPISAHTPRHFAHLLPRRLTLVKKRNPIQEKLYRDPVHDTIALDVSAEPGRVLARLIDAPEVQRLRRVRQLGLAYYAYQGAEHSRFVHVLGVMHLMGKVLRHLQKGYDIDEHDVFIGQCAALLHDVGHGPFSHVFERFTEKHHEDWSREIILSDESDLNPILTDYDLTLPKTLTAVLHDRTHKPGILTDLISSQLDVDRMDYLLRDGLMTGVKHGVFDLERLIHLLRINTSTDRVVVDSKGLHPVEKYLHARYHMYRQVYQHKTVVAAEAMLTALLSRVRELLMTAGDPNSTVKGLEEVALPSLVKRLLMGQGKDLSVRDYCRLDEPTLYFAMNELRGSSDDIARDLAHRLATRRLFKTFDVDADDILVPSPAKRGKKPALGSQHVGAALLSRLRPQARAIVDDVHGLMKKRGLDPNYYFLIIESGDAPYRPYHPAKNPTAKNIMIEQADGSYRDVADVGELVRALTSSRWNAVRFVYPAQDPRGRDLRGPIEKMLAPLAQDQGPRTEDQKGSADSWTGTTWDKAAKSA